MKHWGNYPGPVIMTFRGCRQLGTNQTLKLFPLSVDLIAEERNYILLKYRCHPTAQRLVNKHRPCGAVSATQCQLSELIVS